MDRWFAVFRNVIALVILAGVFWRAHQFPNRAQIALAALTLLLATLRLLIKINGRTAQMSDGDSVSAWALLWAVFAAAAASR